MSEQSEDGTETPTVDQPVRVWESYTVYDSDGIQADAALFTNQGAAVRHICRVVEKVHGIELGGEDFEKQNQYCWRAEFGQWAAVVVNTPVHESEKAVEVNA